MTASTKLENQLARAKREYTEGIQDPDNLDDPESRFYPSLRDLARRIGIHREATLFGRASQERWGEIRAANQLKAANARRQERAKQLGRRAVEFDEKLLAASEKAIHIIMARLDEIQEEMAARAPARAAALDALLAGETVSPKALFTGAGSGELMRLLQAARDAQAIGDKALGQDAKKFEISGPGGGPITMQSSIAQELARPDKERLAQFVEAAGRIIGPAALTRLPESETREDEAVDAEVVEAGEDLL